MDKSEWNPGSVPPPLTAVEWWQADGRDCRVELSDPVAAYIPAEQGYRVVRWAKDDGGDGFWWPDCVCYTPDAVRWWHPLPPLPEGEG